LASDVHYDSNDRKLVLLDQLCFYFTSDVLVGHFQPLILESNHTHSIPVLRTTFQLFQQMLSIIQTPAMVMAMYKFLFGDANGEEAVRQNMASDDDRVKDAYDQLDDEPEDLLAELRQDVSPFQEAVGINPDKQNEVALQFSKLNFKAKNQASTFSIHDPFGSKIKHKEIIQ